MTHHEFQLAFMLTDHLEGYRYQTIADVIRNVASEVDKGSMNGVVLSPTKNPIGTYAVIKHKAKNEKAKET